MAMTTATTIKMFLMGMIAALLLVIALKDGRAALNSASAADSGQAGGTIALVSNYGQGNNKLGIVLVDTSTKHIAIYQADDNSKFFSLVAARNYGYDLGIDHADYDSSKGYDVSSSAGPKSSTKGKTAKSLYDESNKR
jgi:hypothetical protein